MRKQSIVSDVHPQFGQLRVMARHQALTGEIRTADLLAVLAVAAPQQIGAIGRVFVLSLCGDDVSLGNMRVLRGFETV